MRAFIALDVPDGIKDRVEALQKELGIEGLLFVKREAMHVTLQFLGEITAEETERVKNSMQAIRFAPFSVVFSGLSYFTPDFIKVIFVKVSDGNEELKELYAKLGTVLSANGIRFENEDYTPHLTLARVRRVGDRRALVERINKYSDLELGSFDAKAIALKESTLTPDGPVYKGLYELKL